MNRTSLPLRRSAFALGLALAATTGSFGFAPAAQAQRQQQPAAPAAPRLALSRDFQTASNAALTAWLAAKARPDVVAARQAMATAQTGYENARGAAAQATTKSALDAAKAALMALVQTEVTGWRTSLTKIANNDDKSQAGSIGYDIGLFTMDDPIRRQSLVLQLEGGRVAPDQQLVMKYLIGRIDFFAGDIANAQTNLLAATQGGYHANDVDRLLAETYFSQNDAAGGLAVLRSADELAIREARAPVAGNVRRGLNVAKDAMRADDAGYFGARLIELQPDTASWQDAIAAVRRAGSFDNSVLIDLLRVMQRSNSFDGNTDYMEFIQVTNSLKYPRELLAVLQQGIAGGHLLANVAAVSEARADANARETLDRNTNLLPDYERDARAPGANVATITGAADSFLSYGQPVKAEEFYALALTKPGVDSGLALTRMGIAQFDQGKFTEAAASFARVTGPRAPIAMLWAVLSRQRATPAAAPAS